MASTQGKSCGYYAISLSHAWRVRRSRNAFIWRAFPRPSTHTEDRCFKRINSLFGNLPDLQLNWDADTGLWLTDILDPENHLVLNLTHVETLAQLTRLYWLLTGRHLLYHLKPFELSSVRLKSLPPINGSQKIRFNRPNDNR